MSRGPGKLQRKILRILESEGGAMPLRELLVLLPGVDRSNLRRAIRSLENMAGRISLEFNRYSQQRWIYLEEIEEDKEECGISDAELSKILAWINSP